MGLSSGWVLIVTPLGRLRKIQTRGGRRKIAAIRCLAIKDPIDINNRLELRRERSAG